MEKSMTGQDGDILSTVPERHIPFEVFQTVRLLATPQRLARLDLAPKAKVQNALEFCAEHDRAVQTEEFVFLDDKGQKVDPSLQDKFGREYFTCLNRIRWEAEFQMADRIVTDILALPAIPKPDASDVRRISFHLYSLVTAVGRSDRYLTTDLPLLSKEELVKLYRWSKYCDKAMPTQHLVFLDANHAPQPTHVQRLWGWRYLGALTEIQNAIQSAIAIRTLTETDG